jgi:hypothetical protein
VQLPQLATPVVTLEEIWEAMPVATLEEKKLAERQPNR